IANNQGTSCGGYATLNVTGGTPTVTPTTGPGTPTPTPPGGNQAWIKIKNGAFAGVSDLNNPIPLTIQAFDESDTTTRQFIINDAQNVAGVVSANTIILNGADP